MDSESPGHEPPLAHGLTSPSRRQRLGVGELMLLIAGLSLGLWIVVPEWNGPGRGTDDVIERVVLLGAGCLLGGLSLVGVPLLLSELRTRRSPWGPGKLLWFSSGTAAWLLWPPVVYKRLHGGQRTELSETMSGMCFAYGTPLMALYVTAALIAGGWFGRRRRRRLRRSWREQFGLILGAAWACTGFYVLYLLYREDLTR